MLPLVDGVLGAADGRPYWQLPVKDLDEGPVVDVLDAAQSLSDPDRAAAVLHHHRRDLFPLLTASTRRVVHPLAAALSCTPWAVIHRDLTSNDPGFTQLETDVEQELGVRLTRLRLHDLLTWLVVTRRWADALAAGAAAPPT
ncbi:hypothetical protein F1C76_02055 [Geodermatophilaceae bacterium NBWT11]|nr:hypothetical protein F1C76_02055 [Geodermatophilaceae bacterium NBWT11]